VHIGQCTRGEGSTGIGRKHDMHEWMSAKVGIICRCIDVPLFSTNLQSAELPDLECSARAPVQS
jgi:hypothetical protein